MSLLKRCSGFSMFGRGWEGLKLGSVGGALPGSNNFLCGIIKKTFYSLADIPLSFLISSQKVERKEDHQETDTKVEPAREKLTSALGSLRPQTFRSCREATLIPSDKAASCPQPGGCGGQLTSDLCQPAETRVTDWLTSLHLHRSVALKWRGSLLKFAVLWVDILPKRWTQEDRGLAPSVTSQTGSFRKWKKWKVMNVKMLNKVIRHLIRQIR